jgi:hypothetical protein
VAYSEELGV